MTRTALVPIIDDQPLNRELAKEVVALAGYRSALADSAEDGRRRITEERPDLILMDVEMPGEDGLSFTQQLKGDPATRGIPIVALTAYALPQNREAAIAAGCDGFVSKPIEIAPVVALIQDLLSRGAADR